VVERVGHLVEGGGEFAQFAGTDRSPLAIARVTVISLVTGRVMRRATARPVMSASRAASPAVPAMARSSAVRRTLSAAPRPDAVRPTSTVPTRRPLTNTGTLD
jgi:hypothetical protein